MTATRAQRAEQTRQTVLDTAARLFAEYGYDGTSLQMIADDMGITKAAVYYYFRTKAELLHALMLAPLAGIEAILTQAAQHRRRGARIEFAVGAFVELLVSARTLHAMKYSDPAMSRELDTADRIGALREYGMRVLFGDSPTPYERTAFMIVSSLGDQVPALGALTDDELRDTLTRISMRLLSVRA
jgi:AcrR family transcriptional regulator